MSHYDHDMTTSDRKVVDLYLNMPDAPKPDRDEDGRYDWPAVRCNEHWMFCASIVDLIEQNNPSLTQD